MKNSKYWKDYPLSEAVKTLFLLVQYYLSMNNIKKAIEVSQYAKELTKN